MTTAILFRDYRGPDCTLGYLVIEGESFHTLEPPWRDNQRNVSCIPTGVYQCAYLPRSASGKYRRVWHVGDVEGRSGILIHNGNVVDHTKGCIILGSRRGMLAGQRAVLGSRTAMSRLRDIVGEEPFYLSIMEAKQNVAS